MSRAAIAISGLLLLAACRSGFPSLSTAPDGQPPDLVAARAAAAADIARLERDAADLSAPPPAAPALRPGAASLLATAAADQPFTPGVVRRAIEAARAQGRNLHIVGVGPEGADAAARAAEAFRRQGAQASVGRFAPFNPTGSRIELYLLP